MNPNLLIVSILLPLLSGLAVLAFPKQKRFTFQSLSLAAVLLNLILAFFLFNKEAGLSIPWAGFTIDFSLRLYQFSSFILAASAGFSFLIVLYSLPFMAQKDYARNFYSYLLISLAFVNGAVLSDNLICLLFFWEGLLLTLFGLIMIGGKDSFKTSIKAFIIVGISDLCMMVGIALTASLAQTLTISKIHLELTPLAALAFVLLVIGAISKAGSMPFHTWIPDAAVDAPLPFMAFLPAALEKLLGIYFLARITLDMFKLTPESGLSTFLMIVGAITILLAVMMALIQKDYKRLLSYHAISQVGYMILGIGTAIPIGIVGGIFHMINHAMYKCCLFLTGGSVEKQAGTTDLERLGGLMRKMPITFGCFVVAAASISGVPPFNGFFSKELVYDAALERGMIFYVAAALGSFFTAISFLKLGHSAFLGKMSKEHENVKESPWPMLTPMIVIAFLCVLFGVYNAWPLNNLIQPILGERIFEHGGHGFSGWPSNVTLVLVTLGVIALAVITHTIQAKVKGKGVKATDYIHYAPGLSQIYQLAEKRFFDPYDIGLKFVGIFSKVGYTCDRFINWLSDGLLVGLALGLSRFVRALHTGNHTVYLGWSVVGAIGVVFFLLIKG